jgi:hypothetical protein
MYVPLRLREQEGGTEMLYGVNESQNHVSPVASKMVEIGGDRRGFVTAAVPTDPDRIGASLVLIRSGNGSFLPSSQRSYTTNNHCLVTIFPLTRAFAVELHSHCACLALSITGG